MIEFFSRTHWLSTHQGLENRHDITAVSKRMRCWSSQSWRVTRMSQASLYPNHDGHKTKTRATLDLNASGWRKTSWSMGQSNILFLFFLTKFWVFWWISIWILRNILWFLVMNPFALDLKKDNCVLNVLWKALWVPLRCKKALYKLNPFTI